MLSHLNVWPTCSSILASEGFIFPHPLSAILLKLAQQFAVNTGLAIVVGVFTLSLLFIRPIVIWLNVLELPFRLALIALVDVLVAILLLETCDIINQLTFSVNLFNSSLWRCVFVNL